MDAFLGASSSPIEFRTVMQVNGDGSIEPRVDLVNADVNINSVGDRLRLSGGSQTVGDTNTMTNTTINGPGTLELDHNTALRGTGVINAVIDDNGGANLVAAGGTLTIGGSIVDIGRLGADGAAAVLEVTNPWNTSAVINGVRLNDGTLTGATVTNDGAGGIIGFGVIDARVDNNSHITAENGGTLRMLNQTPALLDGTTDSGNLRARTGDLVVEYAANTAVSFNGSVRVDAGQEFFGDRTLWSFTPGSTLELDGGTFRSNRSTVLGGTADAAAGSESVITNRALAQFSSTSNVTLDGDLRLVGTSEIESGAATNQRSSARADHGLVDAGRGGDRVPDGTATSPWGVASWRRFATCQLQQPPILEMSGVHSLLSPAISFC